MQFGIRVVFIDPLFYTRNMKTNNAKMNTILFSLI